MTLGPEWWELTAAVLIAALLGLAGQVGLRLRFPVMAKSLYRSEQRAMVAVGLISLSVAAFSSAIRPPNPFVHDQFSYLLAADTFAQGRLTNPTHPLWRHFETFHVIQRPSNQSKYPPAQGLAMSVGQVLTGHPIAGVWLSLSLACMALYWCLRLWTPRGWAIFGGLLPCFRFGSGLYFRDNAWAYWATSYWGGAVAMLGGCLALGAAVRQMRGKAGSRESIVLGLGLSILAASRPLEGLALATPLTLILARQLWKRGGLRFTMRCLAPAAAIVAVGLSAQGFYNWRVTGSPLTMPYHVYSATYDVVPVFRWEETRPEPVYENELMREYHMGFMVNMARPQIGVLDALVLDVKMLASFLLARPLSIAALIGLLCWRSRSLALVVLLLGVGTASHAATLISPFRPHYFAPFVPLAVLLTVRGMRVLAAWKFRMGRPGKLLARGIVVAAVGAFVVSAGFRARESAHRLDAYSYSRGNVESRLLQLEGPQLVIGRYSANHNVHKEWVYNRANIDTAKIVWARERSEPENTELLKYFNNRNAWLLEPDTAPLRLSPYPVTGAPSDH